MEQTKIPLKIYEPLLTAFDAQIDRLCLKRDAFLNHIMKTEVRRLRDELKGKRQSFAARRYISGELKRLGTRTVNVVVDKAVAEMLNEIVESSNMVRDAFANRLLMFLRASPKLLKYLELPLSTSSLNFNCGLDDFSTSPLAAMEELFGDPLYYLRAASEERFDEGLYLLELPKKFSGFSCYLPDASVPGTAEQKEAEELSREMLNELEEMESLAFDVPSLAATKGVTK